MLLLKYWKYGAAVALTAIACIWAYNAGQADIHAEWDAHELVELKAEELARIEAQKTTKAINKALFDSAVERDSALADRNQLRAENDLLRNTKPIVQTVRVDGVCHYPDAKRWVRDYNASARPSALRITGQAHIDGVPKVGNISPDF